MFSPVEYLRHILDEVDFLLDKSSKITKQDLLNDPILQRAFTRSLEIIGEAVKKLPKSWRDMHNQIDWRSIAGMRDKLIHGYFSVDYTLVWDVIINELPELKPLLEELIKQENE